ncbi:Maf family protein [Paraferrimonas haliotis]|uniref:dTTP/UTP pyrophosphatase n=1 Tax=Paraferrimonas haliotis TaxID=2013866 RepID=A0AA37TJ23_9GAMM|nr:Maf family protein [Paraferrimonas haliotis]GLS82357.1 Maf-like protein [Paraferrimonas haliotis]
MNTSADIVLASASPRRRQLLSQLGYRFSSVSCDIDETPFSGEAPAAYVERLANEKAKAGLIHAPTTGAIVLGSDTIVVIDNCLLGKPKDAQHSAEMLTRLSGNEHQVMTAVAVTNGFKSQSVVVTTVVRFCQLTEQQIKQYWDTGEPADKAGSYGIQGIGGNFVESINGSYSSVVGLPLVETRRLVDSALEWNHG